MTDICSILAYQELVESGADIREQDHIYWNLCIHGDSTSAELYVNAKMNYGNRVLTQSRARFTELVRAGRIIKISRRPCSITGRLANVFHACDPPWIPIPDKDDLPSREELKAMLDRCMAHCRNLENELARVRNKKTTLQLNLDV